MTARFASFGWQLNHHSVGVAVAPGMASERRLKKGSKAIVLWPKARPGHSIHVYEAHAISQAAGKLTAQAPK